MSNSEMEYLLESFRFNSAFLRDFKWTEMTGSDFSHHAVRARVDPRLTGTRTFFYTYIALLGCLPRDCRFIVVWFVIGLSFALHLKVGVGLPFRYCRTIGRTVL